MWFLHWNFTSTCWETWVLALCFPWWVKLPVPVFSLISISVLCVLVVPLALPCSCHQILANAELLANAHLLLEAVPAATKPQTNPKSISSLWQDGNISYTIFCFCISILFSCLLIRNLDLSCPFTDHPKTFISSLVCLGRGKKLRMFSWILLSFQSVVWVLLLHACISVELNLSQKDVLSMPKLSIYII